MPDDYQIKIKLKILTTFGREGKMLLNYMQIYYMVVSLISYYKSLWST